MRIVDLFSGLGGLTIGAYQAAKILNQDFEIYLASDFEIACSDFYQLNFAQFINTFHTDDITKLDTSSLERKKVDYLFAGPPCQGHSDLNNLSRRSDPRNTLYLETIKFIEHFQPRVFMIENVPTVVHSKQGVVETAKELLHNRYDVIELVIDFEKLGIAQSRKRHILLGSINEIPSNILERLYNDKIPATLLDVVGDIVDVKSECMFDSASRMSSENKSRADYLFENDMYDLPNFLRPRCHRSKHSYKSMYGRMYPDKPAQTITGGFGSMGQGRFLHPLKRRVITPHEAARIQGLPDWLNFNQVLKRRQLHQMIGNAVPPILSQELIITMESVYG